MNIRQRSRFIDCVDGSQRKVVCYDGMTFYVSEDPIEPGDDYLAERNTGPQLMVCKAVNHKDGWIIPEGLGYPYDIPECIKVVDIKDN